MTFQTIKLTVRTKMNNIHDIIFFVGLDAKKIILKELWFNRGTRGEGIEGGGGMRNPLLIWNLHSRARKLTPVSRSNSEKWNHRFAQIRESISLLLSCQTVSRKTVTWKAIEFADVTRDAWYSIDDVCDSISHDARFQLNFFFPFAISRESSPCSKNQRIGIIENTSTDSTDLIVSRVENICIKKLSIFVALAVRRVACTLIFSQLHEGNLVYQTFVESKIMSRKISVDTSNSTNSLIEYRWRNY